jgi:two-component system, chemotaxis family, chemotaxis protein CheY
MRYCLIADDSAAVRKAVRVMLSELGFEVGEAADGQQALESCHARRPDALLLDWNMPVMDGMGVLAALGETGARPKVIFCTSGAESAPISRALAAGANECLVKPFDKDLLASKFELLGLF